jgi:hypothetical protein
VIARQLSPGDIGLVQKYAEVQVTSFAANLEGAVQAAAVSVQCFILHVGLYIILFMLFENCGALCC